MRAGNGRNTSCAKDDCVFTHQGPVCIQLFPAKGVVVLSSMPQCISVHVQAHVALLLRETGDRECINHDNAPDSRM